MLHRPWRVMHMLNVITIIKGEHNNQKGTEGGLLKDMQWDEKGLNFTFSWAASIALWRKAMHRVEQGHGCCSTPLAQRGERFLFETCIVVIVDSHVVVRNNTDFL